MSSLSSAEVSEEPKIHPAGLAASLPTGGKVVPLSSASAISDSVAAVLKSNMWVLPSFVARDSLRRESFSYGEPKAFSNFSVELWLLLPFCLSYPLGFPGLACIAVSCRDRTLPAALLHGTVCSDSALEISRSWSLPLLGAYVLEDVES